jgi:hypothetical protein
MVERGKIDTPNKYLTVGTYHMVERGKIDTPNKYLTVGTYDIW